MHRLAEENCLGWLGVGGLTGHVNAPHNSLLEEGYASMNANDLQIGDLLAQRAPYQVPKYQRSYAWEEEELKDFINDLENAFLARQKSVPKRHFFGGLVCLQYVAQNALGRTYEVIDGQQRLATFGLLFARLHHWNKAIAGECQVAGETDNAELAAARAAGIKTSLLQYADEIDGKPVQQPRVVLSKADKEFYAALLTGTTLTPTRESHKLLIKANNAIDNFIKRILGMLDNKSKLAALGTLCKAATDDCHVVHLVSESKDEAYRLFEVLNDRGRSLSEGDLLRSTTLERLEGSDALQEQAQGIWDEILAARASHVDHFLRVYYASRVGKRAGHRSLFDDFLSEFFPRTLSHAQIIGQLTLVRSAFVSYNCISEGEWPYEESVVAAWERNRLKLLLLVLKNELSLPLLLASCELTEKNFAALVHLLELSVFRYIHCCRQHPSKLDSVFLANAVEIRKSAKDYKTSALRTGLKTLLDTYAGDDVFGQGIRSELVYREKAGNTVSKYFLTTIEQFHAWYRAGAAGVPKCKDKSSVYDFGQIEIEHVYPRNATTKNPILEPLKNRLGNLSFWAPADNTKAANQSFTAKKKVYAESKVLLNRELAKLSKFEEKQLRDREDELVKRGLAVFRM